MENPRPGPSRGRSRAKGKSKGRAKAKRQTQVKVQAQAPAQVQPQPKKIKLKDLRIILHDCAPSPDPANFGVLEQVFENELILDLIAEHLKYSFTDLKVSRRVCEKWKRAATKRIQKENWKRRNFLELSTDKQLKKYIDTISASPDDVLFSCYVFDRSAKHRRYDESLMKSVFDTLSQKIKSVSLAFDFHSGEQIEHILKTQSNSLTELQVYTAANELANDSKFSPVPVPGPSRKNKDFQLTNLNFLCFSLEEDDEDYIFSRLGDPGIPSSSTQNQYNVVKIILSKIPAGKPVKICLMQWERIRATIPVLKMYNQIKNLKVLELSRYSSGELKRGELQALADAGVQLQFLALEPAPDFESGEPNDELQCTKEVFRFIGTQAANLEMLSWGSNWNFKFPPRMPKLRKLRLNCEKYDDDSESESDEDDDALDGDEERNERRSRKEWVRSCGPILYEQIFPELDELDLISERVDSLTPTQFLDWFIPPQLPCKTVTKLTIDYPGIDVQIMKTISSTFPCITSLAISYSKEFMTNRAAERAFYSALFSAEFAPILQVLCIEYQADTTLYSLWRERANSKQNRRKFEMDVLFSGLPEGRIRQITKTSKYAEKDYSMLLSSGRGSILDLTSLKKLVIHATEDVKWKSGHLTDFSVFCLFGRMQNLEFLHVDESVRNFSKASMDHLLTKYKPRTLPYLSAVDHIDEIFESGFHTTGSEQFNRWKPVNLLDAASGKEPKKKKTNDEDDYDWGVGVQVSDTDSDSDSDLDRWVDIDSD